MTTVKVNGQFVQYDKIGEWQDVDAKGKPVGDPLPVYGVFLRGEKVGGDIRKVADSSWQAWARNGLAMPARDSLNEAIGDVVTEVGRDYRV